MVAVILGGPQASVHAQAPDPLADMKQSCAGDYFRFCAGADPYGDEVRQCFVQQHDNLSVPCRTAIDAYHRRTGLTRSKR